MGFFESWCDRDLFDTFTLCEPLNHLDSVGDVTVQGGITRIDDFASRVDRFVQFGRAEQACMVVHFERQPEGIHLLVARPTVLLPGDTHPFPQRVVRLVG